MQPPPLGLYIHLPWCEKKCPYCDFNSHEARTIPETEYVDTLLRDLEKDCALAQGRPVSTLFIGGGTPSLFSARAIERLLAGIGSLLPLAPDLEATMEANPGSAEAAKFAGFRAAGINRLSLGVQSFDDARLEALGRVHTSDQAAAAIEYARAAGFYSFNIDLMHGLPGQTLAGAESDLNTALGFKPPHLSWYQLTIEPNTVFHKRPPLLPVEDALADIQDKGEHILAGAGYQQYEVSAYAAPGYQCRHNLNYWSFGDYLAVGAGAHGKRSTPSGVVRYRKPANPLQYLQQMESGGDPDVGENVAGSDLLFEFLLNALRLVDGFNEQLFLERTRLPLPVLRERLAPLAERGLVAAGDGGQWQPTPKGRLFLNDLQAHFLPD